MRKIKLIWDFRGQDAEKIAIHHIVHINEFLKVENKEVIEVNTHCINELYIIAYLVVNEEDMIFYRDSLKPHRGEVYLSNS